MTVINQGIGKSDLFIISIILRFQPICHLQVLLGMYEATCFQSISLVLPLELYVQTVLGFGALHTCF